MSSKILIYPLMLLTAVSLICSSCSKDDNEDNNATTVKDIDGNVYHTVTIGTQVWMAENLKTTKYSDGTAIPLVTGASNWDALTSTSKAYCWYNADIANKATYGALYTWAAATNEEVTISYIQGVCPTGWHLPSVAEWTILTTYLGGESVAGNKLKEKGTAHWMAPNTGATNETGFTALPGGSRLNNGIYYGLLNYGYWWSCTDGGSGLAYSRDLFYDQTVVHPSNDYKEDGFSVRCLKDN